MRTTQPIAIKLGRYIAIIKLSTWLNFREILLQFFSEFCLPWCKTQPLCDPEVEDIVANGVNKDVGVSVDSSSYFLVYYCRLHPTYSPPSSIVHALWGVDANCPSLSGIPQPCHNRCHAVAEYEPTPQHYWTSVGPHHQRTQADGKQTPECCRTLECHSHHSAEHLTGRVPEAREKLQTMLWSCDSSTGVEIHAIDFVQSSLLLFSFSSHCFILLIPHEIKYLCFKSIYVHVALFTRVIAG